MDLLAHHGWIAWIIIGAVVGIIAKAIMPGRDPQGCIVTILLGIAGALLAGYLEPKLGIHTTGRLAQWIAAILGAIIILFIYRLIAGRRRY
ncbi:MAG: GlsB/YeaQ/YmgE family stress response rane protein [Alphaproteobacteria bacterium]|nr:GlsB/YeaQ/YmgE family stress response rane protein [Alphaproteobacteria bacterium]